MEKAKIVDVKRFAVHDGDGIRTTVFFKGCPLECKWCHNPEGISFQPELAYFAHKCVGCGVCTKVCKAGAHEISADGHVFLREKCVACGTCAEECPGGALTFYGKEMTVEELVPILLEDRDFYENSNGGITVSGGEPLMQCDFVTELLKQMKANGIHTAVDTCGFVPRSAIDRVMPYTDIFLYDMKGFDEQVHIHCTGHSNRTILENLEYINRCGKPVEIRIPYVPEYNADQIDAIGKFLATFTPKIFRTVPVGEFAGTEKYWPWFWLIVPCYVLVTPMSMLLALIFVPLFSWVVGSYSTTTLMGVYSKSSSTLSAAARVCCSSRILAST